MSTNPTPVSGSEEPDKGVSDLEQANPTVSDRLDLGGSDLQEENLTSVSGRSDEVEKGVSDPEQELKDLQFQVIALRSELAQHSQYTIPDVELSRDESALEKVKKVRMLLEDLSSYILHIRVAKLMASILFDETTFSKPTTRRDQKGICIVVIHHLIRKLWVRKKELAECVKINEKLLSEILGFLKEKHFVKCFPEEAEEETKGKAKRKRDSNTYYCLDYDKIPKVAQYLNLKVQEKLNKDKMEQNYFYLCEKCNKYFSSLDAVSLLSADTDVFVCEICGAPLINLAKSFENIANNRIQRTKDFFAPIQRFLDEIESLPSPIFPEEPVDSPDGEEEDTNADAKGTCKRRP